MSATDYNAPRASTYAPGWIPPVEVGDDRINLDCFDPASDAFAEKVKGVQRMLGTSVDGYFGPNTVDAIARHHLERMRDCDDPAEGHVIVGPRAVPVDAPTRLYLDHPEMDDTGSRDRRGRPRDAVENAVVHFDVTFSAEMTHRVLLDRGYSTHFTVDGDDAGTIWQHHNPATEVCYHAGGFNRNSFGVDLNNPALPKYRERDADNRGRSREVEKQHIHGRPVEYLDYFPEQIESLDELLDATLPHFGVPRQCPRDGAGDPIHRKLDDKHEFDGVVGHYHVDRQKTDPAPLDWNDVCPR